MSEGGAMWLQNDNLILTSRKDQQPQWDSVALWPSNKDERSMFCINSLLMYLATFVNLCHTCTWKWLYVMPLPLSVCSACLCNISSKKRHISQSCFEQCAVAWSLMLTVTEVNQFCLFYVFLKKQKAGIHLFFLTQSNKIIDIFLFDCHLH